MCDTLVSVTDDGVLFAKNSDRDPNEAQVLEWHPAAEHAAGTRVACTWIDIAQVARTNAVVLSRPWWMWGAEIGANEHGVVIGNEAVFTRELARRGDDPPGLLGMDLLRLALERAGTAHAAVGVIVELLERHGQVGSCSHDRPGFTYDNSFLVADPHGAVVVETAGRAHATEVITAGGRAISNGLTIARFAEAHADRLRTRVSRCSLRRARTEATAATARTPGDLMAGLRDHGTGAAGPTYSPLTGALSAPCAHAGGLLSATQTTASWVADLRSDPLHWATATSAPCTSIFKPVRVDCPVELGPAPGDAFDPRTLWWRHELLHRASMHDHAALVGRFAAERDALEHSWRHDPPPTGEAVAVAEAVERRWTRDVAAALAQRPRDLRPPLVRRLWRRFDEAAGISTHDSTTRDEPVAPAESTSS